MAEFNLTSLQNGSDIRGIAIKTPEHEITLTDERIEKIAYGFAVWLKEVKKLATEDENKPLKVSVGHDSRLSAERIKKVFTRGLTNAGINVIDVGLSTTPAMFMSTKYDSYACDGAVMVTASCHLNTMD